MVTEQALLEHARRGGPAPGRRRERQQPVGAVHDEPPEQLDAQRRAEGDAERPFYESERPAAPTKPGYAPVFGSSAPTRGLAALDMLPVLTTQGELTRGSRPLGGTLSNAELSARAHACSFAHTSTRANARPYKGPESRRIVRVAWRAAVPSWVVLDEHAWYLMRPRGPSR